MAAPKKQPATVPATAPISAPVTSINNCTFSVKGKSHNKHTRAAVVALAEALEANANALEQAAKALAISNASMDCGIKVG